MDRSLNQEFVSCKFLAAKCIASGQLFFVGFARLFTKFTKISGILQILNTEMQTSKLWQTYGVKPLPSEIKGEKESGL